MEDIKTLTDWDTERNEKIQELTGKKWNEISETLFWNKEAILQDLKINYVKIDDDVEMMWYKWKNFHIKLPAVWNFEWFKFDCFVSDDEIYKSEFEYSWLWNSSYSIIEILELFQAFNKYMNELGINMDWDITDWDRKYFEYDLEYWGWGRRTSEAWDFLKEIMKFNSMYRLKDVNVAHEDGSRAIRNCCYDKCNFDRVLYENKMKLLFKL